MIGPDCLREIHTKFVGSKFPPDHVYTIHASPTTLDTLAIKRSIALGYNAFCGPLSEFGPPTGGKRIWLLSNSIYYVSRDLLELVQVGDEIISIAHVYNPHMSFQSIGH